MFKGGKAYALPSDLTNLHELNDSTALYISDSLPPVASKYAFPLLITSPKKENWSSFTQTQGVLMFTLPNFSENEMLELRELAFNEQAGCSKAEVEERFLKWGGSARNVLTRGADEPWQNRLASLPSGLSFAVLQRVFHHSTAMDGIGAEDSPHRVINMVPRGVLPGSSLTTADPSYYYFDHAELATPHVEAVYSEHLLKTDSAELHRFLHRAADDPAIAGFRGVLYERTIVIPRICRGTPKCQLQRLSPPLDAAQSDLLRGAALDLSAGLPLVHFRKVEELATLWAADSKDAIFVPLSKQFPVVDFILRVAGRPVLANATVSESHDVKVGNKKLEALLKAVGLDEETSEIPLVWVLPADAFERFVEPGQLKGEAGSDLVSGSTTRHPLGKRLAQYKMLLEVPA